MPNKVSFTGLKSPWEMVKAEILTELEEYQVVTHPTWSVPELRSILIEQRVERGRGAVQTPDPMAGLTKLNLKELIVEAEKRRIPMPEKPSQSGPGHAPPARHGHHIERHRHPLRPLQGLQGKARGLPEVDGSWQQPSGPDTVRQLGRRGALQERGEDTPAAQRRVCGPRGDDQDAAREGHDRVLQGG